MCPNPSKVIVVIRDVFTNVQHNKTCHQNYIKKLRKQYEKSNLDEFAEAFINCLKIPMTHSENTSTVENTLEFAAKFAVSLHSFEDSNAATVEQMCPFLTKLFSFLLTSHECSDVNVRYRVCYFLNKLLNSMGDNAFMDDTLCDDITKSMMERLLDKSPKVRAQAVYALHRLQDPTDDTCKVIRMYLFHMSKDPSAEVRRAVINTIGKNQRTLKNVLKRTRDTNEGVRKAAYAFISRVTVKSLSIKQRETLLADGLNDKSDGVCKVVSQVLLTSWLQHFKHDYMSLLRALDAEFATKTATLALLTLFKRTEKDILLEQIPLDHETKLIPVDLLTAENILFWKCFVEFLHKEANVEMLDECLPELTRFCNYIRDFQTMMGSQEFPATQVQLHKFILHQLFELAKTYDLSDEVGRATLTQLIQDTLMGEHCSPQIIECIVKHYEKLVPDISTRLNALAHVISEIRMPTKQSTAVVVEQLTDDEQHERQIQCQRLKMRAVELSNEMYEILKDKKYLEAEAHQKKIDDVMRQIDELKTVPNIPQGDVSCEEKNDPATMLKCLGIMFGMAQAKSVTTLTSTLRSLFDHMALPSIDHPHQAVQMMALKAVGCCLLLDKELAKKHLMIYFLQFTDEENNDGWIIALQTIFDLFLRYGLDHFEIIHQDTSNENESNRNGTVRLFNETEEDVTGMSIATENGEHNHRNIVNILVALLDNGDREIRTLATTGLCKLLLHRRLSSVHLLTRLIILLFNPATKDDVNLRQSLVFFFSTYMAVVPESHQILERSFLPTLRTLLNAPEESPLMGIEPHHIASFIINLTDSGFHKQEHQDYTVHNNLAIAILAEALTHDSDIDRDTLLKSLKHLNIRCEDEQMKIDMEQALEKISKNLAPTDRTLHKCLALFREKIQSPARNGEVQQENQTDEDGDSLSE